MQELRCSACCDATAGGQKQQPHSVKQQCKEQSPLMITAVAFPADCAQQSTAQLSKQHLLLAMALMRICKGFGGDFGWVILIYFIQKLSTSLVSLVQFYLLEPYLFLAFQVQLHVCQDRFHVMFLYREMYGSSDYLLTMSLLLKQKGNKLSSFGKEASYFFHQKIVFLSFLLEFVDFFWVQYSQSCTLLIQVPHNSLINILWIFLRRKNGFPFPRTSRRLFT